MKAYARSQEQALIYAVIDFQENSLFKSICRSNIPLCKGAYYSRDQNTIKIGKAMEVMRKKTK